MFQWIATECAEGDSHEVIDTETRGPRRVTVTVTQICPVTNAVTAGWA